MLAAEGANHGIKVNAIAPIAATRMLAHSIGGAGPQDDEETQAVLDDLVGQFVHRRCRARRAVLHRADKGFYRSGLSVEDVRDNLDAIRDEADYTAPRGPADEMGELFGTLMSG